MKNRLLMIFLIFLLLFSFTIFAFAETTGSSEEKKNDQNSEEMIEIKAEVTLPIGDVLIDNTDDNVENFVPAEIGMEVKANTAVKTGEDSSVEITLEDGTVIKIGPNSYFIVNQILQSINKKKKKSLFSLIKGKVRAIVNKLSGKDSSFEIQTPNGVASVRGTDFGVVIDDKAGKSDILVFKGTVALFDKAKSIAPVLVQAGKMASIAQEGVISKVIEIPEKLKEEFLKEMKVKNEPEMKEEKKVEEEKKTEEEKTTEKPIQEEQKKEEQKKQVEKKAKSELEKWLEQYLKLFGDFGTIVLPDPQDPTKNKIYATFTLDTELTLGNIGIGLYVPIIYDPANGGILQPTTWYNYNEYVFNFSSFESALNSINSILLKIKYFRINHHDDPFYFKLGNINDFIIGNGINMFNYSNMIEFPKVRHLGLQLKAQLGIFGIDLMLNDIVNPQIVGIRPSFKPMGKDSALDIGFEIIADIDALYYTDSTTNPVIGAAAAGFTLPIIPHNGFLSIIGYGDIGVNYYFYPDSLPAGVSTDTPKMGILDGFGVFAGLRGNVLFIDYRAEYRYIYGTFLPHMFGPDYDLMRDTYYTFFSNYLANPPSNLSENSGLYIEAKFELFRKIHGELSYAHFFIVPSNMSGVLGDTVVLKLSVEKDLIDKFFFDLVAIRPNWDITKIDQDGGLFSSFLKQLVITADLGYELEAGIEVIIKYKIFYVELSNGEYQQQMSYSVTTRFSF